MRGARTPTHSPRLAAIRGATTVEADEPEAIRSRTAELVSEMMHRNDLRPQDIVSAIFTATPDLTAEFPAAAAREVGLETTPLLCAQEIPVVGAMQRCVRVLIHCYRASTGPVRHVYLHEARRLRLDLQA